MDDVTTFNDIAVCLLSLTFVCPDSKVHGDNMGPTWVLLAPDGSHVGPMNLAIRGLLKTHHKCYEYPHISLAFIFLNINSDKNQVMMDTVFMARLCERRKIMDVWFPCDWVRTVLSVPPQSVLNGWAADNSVVRMLYSRPTPHNTGLHCKPVHRYNAHINYVSYVEMNSALYSRSVHYCDKNNIPTATEGDHRN